MKVRYALLPAVLTALVLASCSDDEAPASTMLTEEQLMDPESCKTCHPSQFQEWSGSMHAYAAEDPVFLAMNRRMQRLTNNGDFCVQCHAPVAVRLGATADGLNLQDLPPKLRGVTCFFCHASISGGGVANNPLLLQHDGVMRGGIPNPVPNKAHKMEYSTTVDRESLEGTSSLSCGPCHDIVTPTGTTIERTFKEWTQSIFATGSGAEALACGQCHMPSRLDVAAQAPGVFVRRVHDHSMAGVDIALQPFPDATAQRAAIQKSLDNAIHAQLCVRPGANSTSLAIEAGLRNMFVGHGWPSGSAQDRRAWVELTAYRGTDVVYRSGHFTEREAVSDARDKDLFLLRDRLYDASGAETHNFWEATRFESKQLPPPAGRTAKEDPTVQHAYAVDGGAGGIPDRVTMAVHIRPLDVDILEDLLASGDLTDRSLLDKIATFTLASTELEWKPQLMTDCVTE
jgi:nitrate/TMAO reductase-like tetraheme cytochrome c subunit